MKKLENWDAISESGTIEPLKVGAYIVKITNVIDHPEKECLEIYYDVAEGEQKDHFKNLMLLTGGTDRSRSFRSYKTKAMVFFKQFICAIEKSNPPYKWDWNEKTLIGKYVVAVLGEEEYLDRETLEVKVSVKPQVWRSVQAFKENRIELPAKKLLSEADKAYANEHRNDMSNTDINDDDKLPF